MNHIDKEIKEAMINELGSIKLRDEVKYKIVIARDAELKKIQEPEGLVHRAFATLGKFLNYEIEINLSYALAVLLIVAVIPISYVSKEVRNLETQRIIILEGIKEASWKVDNK